MSSAKALAPEDLPHYTVEHWMEWEGRWELIDGIPWAMTPMPSLRHQRVCKALLRMLDNALESCARCEAMLPLNLRVDNKTVLHPDILVACDLPDDGVFVDITPSLVAEVLSPSTAHKDLNLKTRIYARMGIRYYLLIHPEEEWVRLMESDGEDWTILHEGHDGIASLDLGPCSTMLDFTLIW